jgi:Protein of unknown function (DUF3038)
MTVSPSVMPENLPDPANPNNPVGSPPGSPMILTGLPDMPLAADSDCPRRTREQLDLLLLAIEALDLTGSEALLGLIEDLELRSVIPNRVALWRLRGTNPMRKLSQRRPMTLPEAKTLTILICYLSRPLTAVLRQLVAAHEQLAHSKMSPDHDARLAEYLERFRSLFRSRMNARRTVILYQADEQLDELALTLLSRLLFCTGTSGMQRLWISLFDGEVE